MRLEPGAPAPDFSCIDTHGETIALSRYRGRRLYLAFHRFAACPFCNLRVHRLLQATDALSAAGLSIVAFFQSPREIIAETVGRQRPPFPIVPDPQMHVYDAYGVERSRGAMLRASVRRLPDLVGSIARGFAPKHVDGESTLVPASFLVDESGIVRVAYYGRDIGDHLPIAELHAFTETGSVAR
jgi:peroxiredoxin